MALCDNRWSMDTSLHNWVQLAVRWMVVAKLQQSAAKVLDSTFWDLQGSISTNSKVVDQSINNIPANHWIDSTRMSWPKLGQRRFSSCNMYISRNLVKYCNNGSSSIISSQKKLPGPSLNHIHKMLHYTKFLPTNLKAIKKSIFTLVGYIPMYGNSILYTI